MPLNFSKLEKVVDLGGGVKRARCPACAAAGQDRTGEHLRILADGRFGCCVHPKDGEHRRKIFALAGERSKPQPIKVRVASTKISAPVQSGFLGELGKAFERPKVATSNSDASDGVGEVQPLLFADKAAETESTSSVLEKTGNPISPNSTQYNQEDDYRTARTGTFYSSICTEKNNQNSKYYIKDFCPPVREVREVEAGEKLPFFTPGGTLVIPFNSPERYHWWKSGGQSIAQTRQEILERN